MKYVWCAEQLAPPSGNAMLYADISVQFHWKAWNESGDEATKQLYLADSRISLYVSSVPLP